MRWITVALGVAVLLLGCDSTSSRIPTSTAPQRSLVPGGSERSRSAAPNEAAKWVRIDELDPRIAHRIEEHLANPDFLREAAAAQARSEAAPLRYGVVSEPLPEGAAAAVVRSTHGPAQRLLLVPAQAPSDLALELARLVLAEDERSVPEIENTRVLLVWNDQRIKVGGSIREMHYHIPARATGNALALLHAPRAGTVAVPGIGAAQLVEVEK